jgi:4-amino-4-deoxy-L-arabinose transferase-like glycosyltransferase
VQRFVKLPLMVVTPTSIFPQYPPGYPAILALFVRLGIPSLCGAVLGALAVTATYRMGARTASASVGLFAALLLATHELFIQWASSYMSHVAALTAIALAGWLLLDATGRADRRRDVESALAGFALGVAITVRPVTGLAVGLSLWLALLTRRLGWPRLRRVTVMMCVGLALPFAALLAYNRATNGDPFRLNYRAALGNLTDMGFGPRGLILYDRDVRPVVAAAEFTMRQAVRTEITSALWPLARDLFPVWGLLPLIAIAFAYRVRFRIALVAAFAVLPLVNLFYFSNDARMYVELLPFVLIAAAIVVHGVHAVDPRASRALAIFLVGANVVAGTTHVAADARARRNRPTDGEVVARAIADSLRAPGRLLVFVQNPPLSEPLLVGLSRFNFGRFPGRVVVARDLGAENAQLTCRLPGYRPLRAVASTAARDAHLLAYPGGIGAPARCADPPLVSSTPPTE